jgi:glycosyltransferase involved in cell wall biosynthesis
VKRILVITNNLAQASYRLRLAALIPRLAQRGFDCHVQVRPAAWLARRKLLDSARSFDAVILQRKLLDPWDARRLRLNSRRLFFDVDDAVMFHNRPIGIIARWRQWRRFLATAHAADRVVAGNSYLADYFHAEGASVTLLPTLVDPARYQIKQHAPTAIPRLVWIGSRSTLPYLEQCLPPIRAAAEKIPGLTLVTIADATLTSPGIPIEHIPWSESTESQSLLRGDIGIAPTPLDRWTRGKCGFKILQYMAAALPVIASPIGLNCDLITEQTGLLAAAPDQWTAAIIDLAANTDRRAALGHAGRSRAQSEFNLDRGADIWAALLNS